MNYMVGFSQTTIDKPGFPADFSKQSFEHIINITKVGVHTAGSKEEKEVADYILKKWSDIGIESSMETFEFESFDISQTDLTINQHKIKPLQVCLNPYLGDLHFKNSFVLLDSANTTKSVIENKIVVASFPLDNSQYFRLFFGKPKLILVIPDADFVKLSNENGRDLECIVKGGIKKYTSQNVVGFIPGKPGATKEIILSAHYDSYPGSVGADDNASGVAVLIELTKYFRQFQGKLNVNLRFVAFGGEEKGLVGSRAYVNMHSKDLIKTKLLFNIDQIGAESIFVETTGGVHGIPKECGKNQFPEYMRDRSLEGIESNWRLLAPEALPIFAISNRPEWLENIIKDSVRELLIPVTFAGNTGSDQMAFAQAGIVASAIGTSGNEVHSSKDIPQQIHKQSLVDCGKIAAKIVLKAADEIEH